ncbi:hypothetical protein STEG23_014133 [Scotinomys teguina]
MRLPAPTQWPTAPVTSVPEDPIPPFDPGRLIVSRNFHCGCFGSFGASRVFLHIVPSPLSERSDPLDYGAMLFPFSSLYQWGTITQLPASMDKAKLDLRFVLAKILNFMDNSYLYKAPIGVLPTWHDDAIGPVSTE